MAASDESRLVVRLEASVTQLTKELTRVRQHTENEVGQMVRATDRGLANIERRRAPRIGLAEAVKKETTEAASSLATLRTRLDAGAASFAAIGARAAGAVGALIGINELRQYADQWTETRNRIASAGEATENVGARQSELADLAMRSRSSFGSVVDLYTGLRRATAELGASQAQVLQVTETVSKGFVVGGQSASTAAGAIIQLNQAFQSGKLSGDELNSVLEGAPPIARLIAKEFGVSVGDLKKLAEAGKLTSDKVFTAILKGAGEIEAEFAKTSATVGQSLGNLSTALTRYIGQADQATGASGALAGAIQGVANNIDVVAPAAAVLAATLLGAFAGGPIGAGIAGATSALVLFGDAVKPIGNDIATLGDYGRAAFAILAQGSSEVGGKIASGFQRAAELATAALSEIDAGNALEMVLQAVKAALNATIGAFVGAVDGIRASWNSLGPALAETIVAAMNAVIASVQGAVNKVISAVNSIASAANAAGASVGISVGLGEIKPVDLGKVTSSYAGAGKAAGETFGKAFDAAQRDYVGSAVTIGGQALDAIRKRGNLAATQRLMATPTGSLENGSLDAALRSRPAGGGAGAGGGKGGREGSERVNELDREIEAVQRRTRAFEDEQKTVGRSAEEAAKADASFRLLEAAKRANIPVTQELKDKVDALSSAYAAAKVRLDEAERAHRQIEQSQRFLGDAMTAAVSDLVIEGRTASEVFSNLAKSIAKAALQAALMGSGPFGSGGGGGGGILGGLFNIVTSAITGSIGGGGGSPTGGVRLFSEGGIPGDIGSGRLARYATGLMPSATPLPTIDASLRKLGAATVSSRGVIQGPGTGTSDSILAAGPAGDPIRVSAGESIVTAQATNQNRTLIEALNAGAGPRDLQKIIERRIPSLPPLAPMPLPPSLPRFAKGLTPDAASFSKALDFGERQFDEHLVAARSRTDESVSAAAGDTVTNSQTLAPVFHDNRKIEIKPANGVTPAEMVAALQKYDADLSRNLVEKIQNAQRRFG